MNTRIDFYHLQTKKLPEILPVLVEKAYSTKQRIKILISNDDLLHKINELLWVYNQTSFLPHGTNKDSFADAQPIYLSTSDENPNKAEIIFLVGSAKLEVSSLNDYKRIINIFDGNSDSELKFAREYWKELKETGAELKYWQQENSGKWVEKG